MQLCVICGLCLLCVVSLCSVVIPLPPCTHCNRNPTTGGWRAVKIAGDVLHPPEGGWSDIVYVVVAPPVKVTGSLIVYFSTHWHMMSRLLSHSVWKGEWALEFCTCDWCWGWHEQHSYVLRFCSCVAYVTGISFWNVHSTTVYKIVDKSNKTTTLCTMYVTWCDPSPEHH